jgi:CheY-like chemotaxis protein
VSIKVLLADDNITAQRMGSKILTDAGYEVIAVSNGAAAVKKIASDKPDLLILDVYMPGYTGLEVCEKVKHDPATAAVPVVLTATNMEPYNQADGNRVGADGFMVKPFEASDLVAVVQKYAAKIKRVEEAGIHTVKMAAVEEFEDASYEEWKSEAGEETASSPARMEVPQEMASSPALGMDDYDAPPPAPAFAIDAAPAVFEEMPPPAFAVDSAPFEQPAAAPLEMPSLEVTPASEVPTADSISIFESPVESAPAEFEPTSAPLAPSIEVATAAELETTLVSSPEIAVAQDPALVTNADETSQFATGFGVQNAEEIPVGIAMPEPEAAPPAEEAADSQAEPEHVPTEKIEAYAEPVVAAEAEPHAAPPSPVEMDMQRAFAVSSSGAAVAPAIEPAPEPPPSNAPIPEELVAQFAAELDQAHQEREAMGETLPVEEAPLTESSMEAVKEIPASQMDEEKIAAAVNRALEKYKDGLRAELIATIVRELKG